MGIKSIALVASTFLLSTSVNAVVLNTLNGVDYQWLELTDTQGLSRDAVELRLVDDTDELYGYEYASRQLVEDLLLSYTEFKGQNGFHSDSAVTSGVADFFSDFGALSQTADNGTGQTLQTTEGDDVLVFSDQLSMAFYGLSNECGDSITSCRTVQQLLFGSDGTPVAARQNDNFGWDASHSSPLTFGYDDSMGSVGSFLVRTTVVPVPAAVWLFGSGLLGLVGVARRKV